MSKCFRLEVKTVVSLKDRSSALIIDLQVKLVTNVKRVVLSPECRCPGKDCGRGLV